MLDTLLPNISKCVHALKAAKKYDEDNPHFHQAMHDSHALKYWQAMDLEKQALQPINTWMHMVWSAVDPRVQIYFHSPGPSN